MQQARYTSRDALKAARLRAIKRAQELGGVARVRELAEPGLFSVEGREATYLVRRVTLSDWRCTCRAAADGLVCWHTAAAWLWTVSRQMASRPALAAAPRRVGQFDEMAVLALPSPLFARAS